MKDEEERHVSFLQIEGKTFLVIGVANKRSVAWKTAQVLEEAGATVIYSVRSEKRRETTAKLLADREVHVCDFEQEDQIPALARAVTEKHPTLDGIVHSIAFAQYSEGAKPFHGTLKKDFLQAIDISCFSLVAVANAFKDALTDDASVVTISISTTRMAAENYGFMAPAKAALDSSVVFLAKSFSQFSRVRFNAVCAGLLKTSASAGIPGYVDSFLFAERATLRKKALQTEEVANTAAFLLSPRSSGINAQGIVLDGGMSTNYFDRELVKSALQDS